MKNKNRFLDIALIICVFTFCISFPINIFTDNIYIIKSVQIALRIASISFTIIYKNKSKYILKNQYKTNYINLLILIPTFLAIFNNMIYMLFNESNFQFIYDLSFPLSIFLSILTAISEELIFREIIISNLSISNRLIKIIVSAAIFGLFHIVIFLSTFNPFDLITIIYTFGLGIILGFIYEYAHNIYIAMIYHFLFNFINTDLFVMFNPNNEGIIFYLLSISVGIIIGIYLLITYLAKFKKERVEEI